MGDGLAYNTDTIKVPASCDAITVTITHNGQLPAIAMGHNWVPTTDADWRDVAQAGMPPGVKGN